MGSSATWRKCPTSLLIVWLTCNVCWWTPVCTDAFEPIPSSSSSLRSRTKPANYHQSPSFILRLKQERQQQRRQQKRQLSLFNKKRAWEATRWMANLPRGGGVGGDVKSNLSYYLVWSPGMLHQTLVSCATILVLRFLFGDYVTEVSSTGLSVSSWQRRVVDLVVLPLLSSACCAIQLTMNVLIGASGCAGFNKHLGPLRPYFLGLLLATIAGRHVTRLAVLLPQLLLAFLPEIIHVWNTQVVGASFPSWIKQPLLSRRSTNERADTAVPSDAGKTAVIELEIPGMGCVACINKINGSLRQVAGVMDSSAWLEEKGGKAKVQCHVESIQDAQVMASKLRSAVNGAGFDPCQVEHWEMKESL